MQQIIALAMKDLRLMLRDKAGAFFVFVFPLIYCVFFGVMMSGMAQGDAKISVVVVDEDQTAESAEFVAGLQETPELKVQQTTREEATTLVRRGRRAASLWAPLLVGLGVSALSYAPYLVSDARAGWGNARAFVEVNTQGAEFQ